MKFDDEKSWTDARAFEVCQMIDDAVHPQRAEEVSAGCDGEVLAQFE